MNLNFNQEEGILTITPHLDFKGPETIELARENKELVLDRLGNDLKGALVYMPPFYINAEVTKYYKETIPNIPLALIADSFFKKMLGNFLLRLTSPSRPMRLFSSEEEAEVWLRKEMGNINLSHTG
jgi:hypothetical protein